MKRVLIATALVGLLGAGTVLAEAGALDGKTFSVQVGKKGKAKSSPDELTFADGKLKSAATAKLGFTEPATYTTKAEGTKLKFDATLKSEKAGTMRYWGTVDGDNLAGSGLRSRVRATPVSYWLKGAAKKAEAASAAAPAPAASDKKKK